MVVSDVSDDKVHDGGGCDYSFPTPKQSGNNKLHHAFHPLQRVVGSDAKRTIDM